MLDNPVIHRSWPIPIGFISFATTIAPLICLNLPPAFAETETGLHDDYTKTLSTSADNSTDYIYTGFGDTSGSYSNVSLEIIGFEVSSPLLNSGDISITATGGTASSNTDSADADALARGIASTFSGDIDNSGNVNITATGGTASSNTDSADADALASGIYSRDSGNIDNSGDISVTATGGTASSTAGSVYVTATAYGIYSRDSGNIDNSRDISVTATGGTASSTADFGDAFAKGAGIISKDSGNIDNSGDISVTATGGTGTSADASAYGIYINGDTNLTNTGIITTTASSESGTAEAYELYIRSDTTTLVGTYNVTLDGDPNTGSIYVASGATLNLNDATLSVSYLDNDIQWDTEYTIFDADGTVTGSFGDIVAANPNVTVTYYGHDTDNAADDGVSLTYAASGESISPFGQSFGLLSKSVSRNSSLISQRMLTSYLSSAIDNSGNLSSTVDNSANNLYADAGTTASDAYNTYSTKQPNAEHQWDFFLVPFGTVTSTDASPVGYDADTVGFTAGYEKIVEQSIFGVHGGFSSTDVDYTGSGMSGNSEDLNLWTLGAHAMGRIMDRWTWRTQVTGFYGHSDYDGLTGLSLTIPETANYNSYGVNSTVAAGYLFNKGAQIFFPEVSIDYTWLNRESFSTKAQDSGWNIHSENVDQQDVYATASLRWLTHTKAGKLDVSPSVAIGVRSLLTNDEDSIHLSISDSAPFTSTSTQDDVAGTLAASVLLSTGSNFTTELAYSGEYGDTTTAHTFWARFTFLF